MSPISASIVKHLHYQLPTIFHYLSRLFGWTLILGQPKILGNAGLVQRSLNTVSPMK
ncbi:hypothetical protein NTG1052_300084 [Candidatus Nitrotoga sp. 1052]|nr:hypothetical protein NTG1052_300084 [Candidatus Nitrotoga sp. 1052]